jgi:hypothetical protein
LKQNGYELYFCSEILLLVNLCVALANAYIIPLPPSADDVRSTTNVEAAPAPQQAAPATKKGAKGDQQPTATSGSSSGASSQAVKSEDLKAAVEVNCSRERKI